MEKSLFLCMALYLGAEGVLAHARSPFRTPEPDAPMLITKWVDSPQHYSFQNSYFQEGPLFHLFKPDYFEQFRLPDRPIFYRYEPNQCVQGTVLKKLIDALIIELDHRKKKFTDFVILKKRDFDFKTKTGFLILKFKNYPFVLKLFITTPEQFIKPFDYGFESCCFFIMGGGVTRYLTGFTRLENLARLSEKIYGSQWAQQVEFPRKWFWMPDKPKWITVTGVNIGKENETLSVRLPSMYALVCDEIEISRTFSLSSKSDRETALGLSNFLQQQIDPHINNYVIDAITGKIVLIDTEHFPTMVGLERTGICQDYLSWYLDLSWKMVKDSFCRTKKIRKQHQYRSKHQMNFFNSIT